MSKTKHHPPDTVCRDCHEKPSPDWKRSIAWRDTQRCEFCFDEDRDHRATRRRSPMMDDRSTQELYDAGLLN